MSKKYKMTFKRPSPSIQPRKTGLQALNESFKNPLKYFLKSLDEIYTLYNKNENDNNIKRYSIILACGALDKYMHDITRVMIIKIFNDEAKAGKNFEDFLIPIDLLNKFDKSNFEYEEKEQILDEAIYDMISNHTMQKSYSIERNLNYIIDFNIWKSIQPRIAQKYSELSSITALKKHIDDIATRRNVIAHEMDCKPHSNEQYNITSHYVSSVLDFIEYFIKSVDYQIINSVLEYKDNKLKEESGEMNIEN